MKQIELLISGRVQGVCYRYFTKSEAEKSSINGFVMNLPDGNVKVVAAGNEQDLDIFIENLRKGPSYAEVNNIEIQEIKLTAEFKDFKIEY
ncbi:MAG: acylphosphatase [Candidatus Cloacimonetes bacterium]|nr:acylphosphatase [Candidatus Cloacimonadota bacterium]